MLRLRRLNADGTARGRPLSKLRLALIALALGTMALDGCSFLESNGIGGGCKSCGGLGGLRRTRILFRRRDPGCCGGAEAGTVIEGAAPGVIVPGGAPLTPVIPGAPAEAGSVPDLTPAEEPAPTSTNKGNGPAGTGSAPANAANKTGYNPIRQSRSRPSGGESLVRSIPDLQPTPGSAAGRGRGNGVTFSDNLLDNLPSPVVSDSEVSDSPPAPTQPTPKAPLIIEAPAAPAPATDSTTSSRPETTAAIDPLPEPKSAVAPTTPGPEPAPGATPELPDDVPPGEAPGIAHFKVVNPQVAGGSFPSPPGLSGLVETGYRTVLDLRETSQFRSEDFAAIAHEGLRHLLMPVSADKLNADLVKRFESELAQPDARPIYFCDTDGTRAATLWYIHRVSVDKSERTAARRDAEQLGPIADAFLKAANAYLDSLAPAPAAATATPTEVKPAAETLKPQAEANSPEEPGQVVRGSDSTGWHSYAALAMTALGLPFAYWGCNNLSGRSLRRASLPAPGPRSRALPASSDA